MEYDMSFILDKDFYDNLRRRIKAAQIVKKYDNTEMGKRMGLSTAMWEHRLRNLDKIKLKELKKIDEILDTEILKQG